MSRAYDNPFRAGVGNCRQIRARRRKTVEVLKDWIPHGARCLDLGPPNPLGTAISAARGCQVYFTGNMDLDGEWQEGVTSSHIVRLSPDERLLHRVLGTYDAIFAFEVLEHLFCPLNALIEAERILKPCGLLFVTIPSRPSWLRVKGHYHEMDHFRWCELVKRAGFRIIHEERWPIAWAWPTGIRPIVRMLIARHYFCVLVPEKGEA